LAADRCPGATLHPLAGTSLAYRIITRPNRKTVAIVIRANCDIDVLAPKQMPKQLIEQFVSSKTAWIEKKVHFNREIKSSHQPKTYQPGEQFQLKGQSLTLMLKTGKRAVSVANQQLHLTLPASIAEAKKVTTAARMIEKWYRQQAEEHFIARAKQLAALIGKQPAQVGIKGYKSRWGSCHIDGRIYFNWRLIMAPEWVIDYVIVHELCHLTHHNHSKNYWQLVESVMPDYRNAKTWLKLNGISLNL